MEFLANTISALRQHLNMTQEELAAIIGVSRSTVILFEKRTRSMTWSTFLSLVLVFSKNADTYKLMKALDIYTDELEEILGGK